MSCQARKGPFKNNITGYRPDIQYGKSTIQQKVTNMQAENIALMCHELNKVYCKMLGDDSQVPWDALCAEMRNSLVDAVKYCMVNDPTPKESHENWMEVRTEQGWIFGSKKCGIKKTHPCLVAYDKLTQEHKVKDVMFICMVKMLSSK